MTIPGTDTPTEPAALSVNDLHVSFQTDRGELRAVRGVSFEVPAGRTLGLVGESGSGKSATARSIMNLLDRTTASSTGRVLIAGRDVRSLSRAESRHVWGVEAAMIFQNPTGSLNPVMRIGRQIAEGLRYHRGLSGAAAALRARELLAEVGIADPERRASEYPHQLSGGMRQRVAIAIAIACGPRLLIADEPTTALDVTVQRQILDLLGRLQRHHGMAMLLISHDLGVVAGRADDVAVMYAGRIVETAPTAQLFTAMRHPYTEALFESIPKLANPGHTRLRVIEGRPPDLAALPQGCAFAPRCRYSQARCLTETPALLGASGASGASGGRHRFACFYPIPAAGEATPRTGESGAADLAGAGTSANPQQADHGGSPQESP